MKKVKVLDSDYNESIATVEYVSANDGYPYAKLRFEDDSTGIFHLEEFEVLEDD